MQPILQVSSDQLVPFVLVVGDQQGCGGELGLAPQEVWAGGLISESDLNQELMKVKKIESAPCTLQAASVKKKT